MSLKPGAVSAGEDNEDLARLLELHLLDVTQR